MVCLGNDISGEIDVAEMVEFSGVFAALKDRDYFSQVRVDPEMDDICWPNDANMDSDVLYALVTGEPLPTDEETLPIVR